MATSTLYRSVSEIISHDLPGSDTNPPKRTHVDSESSGAPGLRSRTKLPELPPQYSGCFSRVPISYTTQSSFSWRMSTNSTLTQPCSTVTVLSTGFPCFRGVVAGSAAVPHTASVCLLGVGQELVQLFVPHAVFRSWF